MTAPPDINASVIALRERVRELEHEVAAWRALASLQDGRYDVCFPGRRTLGDFGGSVADRSKMIDDGFGNRLAERTFGAGPTPGAAAIAMAVNAKLIPEAGK